MRQPVLLFILILTGFHSNAQATIDSALAELETVEHKIFASRVYSLASKKKHIEPASMTFESQGMFHSTYLILNNDSSYVYYSVYEVGFVLAAGTWSRYKIDTFMLNWERTKTFNYIKDEKIYKRYFQYGRPSFVPMTNWLIKKSGRTIMPIKL